LPDPQNASGQFQTQYNVDARQIQFQLTLPIWDFKLYELDTRIGSFDLFSDPNMQLDFSYTAGPAHAALALNYLHWTLPQFGPVATSLAVQGTLGYLDSQHWGLTTQLNGDATLLDLEWMNVKVFGQVDISLTAPNTGVVGNPAFGFTFEFKCKSGQLWCQ
jgi:hypothetical protein